MAQLYEYDREPVAQNKLCGALHFAGLYAGEHTAATEFVIGALFVSWGASVVDVFVGLLLGNSLAVLSWTLFCAPIATETRLTLYWYVHKIGGPVLAFIYNICNAILFCILAGTMITVSASAVRIVFDIPAQTAWYPTDVQFVFIVLLVGAVIVVLAILGFRRLVQFASICAPWMIIMFVVGAVAMLPLLDDAAGIGQIRSIGQFWQLAEEMVWTGEATIVDQQLDFWHVVAFAWICNLAMHIGLSDMAAFRFARKARYGLCTATGMFLGHYVAWICAGVLGAGAALWLKTPLGDLDSGAVGYAALGSTGAIAVVLAGWTTANPTLYKAGLAIQAVTPNWPRWKVTLAVGVVTTIIACFPFVFKEMLNFVGLYGLLLMPVGAIVFAEHRLFPKLGLRRYWVYHQDKLLNWPALVAWAVSIGVAMALWYANTLHLFFLFIPVWFLTIALYIILAALAGAKATLPERQPIESTQGTPAMASADKNPSTETISNRASVRRKVSGAIALVALIACLWMTMNVYWAGMEEYPTNLAFLKKWLPLPTLIYFVSATYWQIQRDKTSPAA